ncbi:ArsR family transcriptional regulator [Salinarchaeum sp. IM2453]|uniref:ArsR/SmtB family transcription factor n=1 Tax=Salinarchaeum sp. IM2453 TaxID=2862870 RepID=UPI001C831BBC|nr:helix-turn-helix transcriptional regulator [Salinarchaeum sp. IM2453]QZA89574.1 ArsR family transcriptional regulator [Salinarchaeum sp. IM2453]
MATHNLIPKQIHEPTEDPIDTVDLLDDAGVIEALGSETARQILCVLASQPTTATKLTEHTSSSLQNVMYHLRRLEEVELVEETGVAYSEKGREMTVYRSTTESITVEVEASMDTED